jgi:hypothetical protein
MRVLAILSFAIALVVACTPRSRMCSAPTECPATSACVAGRCMPLEAGLIPTIAETSDAGYTVRRLVLAPVDVAWVRRGDRVGDAAAMPPVFTIGRAADGDAALFLKFAVTVPKDARVVEAYLLLMRSDAVDTDPSPISLHAVRIVESWDSRSISWAAQPRTEEVRAPSTRVAPGGRAMVRLDVRALVERWPLHDRRDQGIGVVAETGSLSGMPFAFLPVGASIDPSTAPSSPPPVGGFGLGASAFGAERGAAPAPVDESTAEAAAPRLELYVK